MLTACGSGSEANKNKKLSEDKVQIISSIKPIQTIVLAIAGELAQNDQLIPDNASPHNYSFKPSDIREMNKADIIFRIDEPMETQLNGVMNQLNVDKPSIVSLAKADGLALLESNHLHQKEKLYHYLFCIYLL